MYFVYDPLAEHSMTNSTVVTFSEEERALLRDPESNKRFRREVEGELHVGVPDFFFCCRHSPIANTRAWDLVLRWLV